MTKSTTRFKKKQSKNSDYAFDWVRTSDVPEEDGL